MLRHRVIPILLVRNGGLVKTRRFEDSVYIGDPTNAVRIFSEKEVDEIALIDIDASRNNSGPNWELVERVAGECFMPLMYGGGVRTVGDAKRLFSLGVEKIGLQSAALRQPSLVSELASVGGSQSVTVAVDVRRSRFGRDRLWSSAEWDFAPGNWLSFVEQVQDYGAGEVLLTSVDREGSMSGLETNLIRQARQRLSIPLIAHGGVGSLAHIADGIQAGADAVGVGSFCVFRSPRRGILISYPDYRDLAGLLGERNAGT